MIVFRLTETKHSNDLTGKGAETYGGRWNSKGTAMIYTCDSRALCTTEIAVHLPLGIVPQNYKLITLNISESIKIKEIDDNLLPLNWITYPHSHSTQAIGDEFVLENKYVVFIEKLGFIGNPFTYSIHIE